MTKKATVLLFLVFFLAGALAAWLYRLHQQNSENTEACSASIVVYHEDIRANLTMDFMYTMKKQTGVIALSGAYYKMINLLALSAEMSPMYGQKIKTHSILHR